MNDSASADLIVNRQHMPHRVDDGVAPPGARGVGVVATQPTREQELPPRLVFSRGAV